MIPTEATVSLPTSELEKKKKKKFEGKGGSLPNTDKLDIHIDAKGFFELVRLLPTYFVFADVHLVCEGDLLVVAGREETDFVDPVVEGWVKVNEGADECVDLHSSEGTRCISSPGKPKDEYSISSLVILHQEFVPA